MHIELALVLLLASVLNHQVYCQSGNGDEIANFVDPHDWSGIGFHNDMDVCRKCPTKVSGGQSEAEMENAVALTYFKKFINSLFNRKRLKYDDESDMYKRSLLFTLLPAQVDELESTNDVRDLDILLTKILDSVRAAPGDAGCDRAKGGFELIKEIVKDFVQLLALPDMLFPLIALSVCIVGWSLHRFMRLPIYLVVPISFVLFGYFVTYLECNRKIQADQMIEVIRSSSPTVNPEELPFYKRWMNSFWSNSLEDQQVDMIKKTSQVRLPFCTPGHVFQSYFSDVLFKQLEMFIERVSRTISNLRSELSYPYSLIAPLLLIALIGYIVKLTFQYILSPTAWASLIHHTSASHAAIPGHQPALNEPTADRLSGENLKMLLNVISASNSSVQHKLPSVSGVQEVMEPLEAASIKSADTTDESGSGSSSSSSSSSNSPQKQEVNQVVVEDSLDEKETL